MKKVKQQPSILTEDNLAKVEERWLASFKSEFKRRAGITWNGDAGSTDEDALDIYFPDDVTESVFHFIEKYGLTRVK